MELKPAAVGLRRRAKGGPSKFTLSIESETKQNTQKNIISASHSRKAHSTYLCIIYSLSHHHQQQQHQQPLLYAAKKETLQGGKGKIIYYIKIITIHSTGFLN